MVKRYLVILLLLSSFIAKKLDAQSINLLTGTFSSDVRLTLVKNWTVEHELGYCVEAWHYDTTSFVVYTDTSVSVKSIQVDSISEPRIGTSGGVKRNCKTSFLHIHTNRICAPSREDSSSALMYNSPFDIIQCDADAFVFYNVNRGLYTYSRRNTLIYGGLIATYLIADEIGRFDTDPGGYPDKWYPQKQGIHFLIASTMTFAAYNAHINPWVAGAMTCGAGIAYEKVEGYVNGKDIVADCSGALITVIWIKIFQKKN